MTWWSRLTHREQMEEQLDQELDFHLEQHIADLVARGYDPGEARRQARLTLGGPEQVKEECRDARGTLWLEDLGQDFRYALRMPLAAARIRGRRSVDAGARHRRDHRDVYGGQRCGPEATALSEIRSVW